jgi:hypothetical protein
MEGLMTVRLGIRFVLCLALCSLSACDQAPARTGSESEALVAPGSIPGRGATPLMITSVDDPLGIGSAGERKTAVVIRSAAAYRAAFGHNAPESVKFNEGEVVIFYSDGVKPTGGYVASVVSVVQIGRALTIATHLSSPGEGCITTDALTTPYALVKVKPRGRTYNTRFQHLRSVDDCEPASCDSLVCPDAQHCELQEIVCITTPCDPIPTCVDDVPTTGPFCGGIAGFPCPGEGECVDDPSDDCDPAMGGADCGGVCTCPVIGLCVAGQVWNDSPEVCGCMPEENPCNLVDCVPGNVCVVQDGEAVCIPDTGGGTNPCAFTLCPINTECVVVGGEAVCKPAGGGGERCGDTTCGAGQVCCNSSCGICTPPDGACIQIACL